MTLRQEAFQILNEIPENSLSELVQNLRDFKSKLEKNFPGKKSEIDPNRAAAFAKLAEWRDRRKELLTSEIDPKKAKAYAAIAEWQKRNRDFLNSGIDWEKEYAEALEEKYGRID